MGRIKDETVSGIKWQLLQRVTLQPVQFLYGIILARLITPHEMGILGLTSIFFAVAVQLQSCGFGAALIRKQDRTEEDCSTVFWFNVAASFVFSLMLGLAAPYFADFFGQPELVALTRISALMMFLSSTTSVHWTLYTARRDFKTPAMIQVIIAFLTIPIGVWAAYAGWSYWAVVLQGVIASMLSLITVWIVSPWKPRFLFSRASFRYVFSFGSKLTLTGLVTTLYTESRTFVVGKFYSPAQLAFFNKGFKLSDMPLSLLSGTVGSVVYPVLSTIQDDDARLIQVYRKYIRLTACVTMGLMLTLSANATSLVEMLYGKTWLTCAFYAQILCFGIMMNPLSSINSNIYLVKGRTDVSLKCETLTRLFGFPAMAVGAFFSVEGICYAAVLSGVVTMLISVYMTSTVIRLEMREQVRDFFPYMVIAALANVPSFVLSFFDINPFVLAPIGCFISLMLYYFMLRIRKDEAMGMFMSLLEEKGFFRPFRKKRAGDA